MVILSISCDASQKKNLKFSEIFSWFLGFWLIFTIFFYFFAGTKQFSSHSIIRKTFSFQKTHSRIDASCRKKNIQYFLKFSNSKKNVKKKISIFFVGTKHNFNCFWISKWSSFEWWYSRYHAMTRKKNDFFGYFRRLEKYFFRIFEKNDLNFFFYKNNVFNISENKIPMMKASVVDLKCDLPKHDVFEWLWCSSFRRFPVTVIIQWFSKFVHPKFVALLWKLL